MLRAPLRSIAGSSSNVDPRTGKANADLQRLDMEAMSLEEKLISIGKSEERVAVLRKKAVERRKHLRQEQALLEKDLDEIDKEAQALSSQEESVAELKKMLQKVRAKQVESWSKANGANVVVGEIPAGTVASSELPSHRIKKEDLRKQQHAKTSAPRVSASLHETVGQMQRERIDQALDSVEVDADGFVDYGKFVDRLNTH